MVSGGCAAAPRPPAPPRLGAAPGSGVAPPPGLASPADTAGLTPEAFAESLRGRPLPPSLAEDAGRLERFESALLSCVEGLYRDRLASTLGEVLDRLRGCGWMAPTELAAVLPFCARKPESFKLVPPACGEPPRVILSSVPSWFTGFHNLESADDPYTADVWEALQKLLAEPGCLPLRGGVARGALGLQRRAGLPASLRLLPLAELRHVLELALGPRRLLRFLPRDGRLLSSAAGGGAWEGAGGQPKEVAPRTSAGTPAGSVGAPADVEAPAPPAPSPDAAAALASALASQPLPPLWAAKGEAKQRQLLQQLRMCIEGLYRERLEPTLREVQQQLLGYGWSYADTQLAPMLCAREPETYVIVPPVNGTLARIELRSTPPWFRGFVPAPGDEAVGGGRAMQTLPAESWQAFAAFLRGTVPVLKGGIDGAARALRQSPLPQLKHLSLGELRSLVRCAVAEQGLLVYAGNNLQPPRIGMGSPASDGRIYSQI
uniref:OST-HTH associated domain-containing protein n=1 Tax=Alexandrium monilatum TaxID=311494 RepID=A0A7S4RX58_9DINO